MKDFKSHLPRIVCTVILICAVCITTSFVLYWIVKAFFNARIDILRMSIIFITFALLFSFPFLIPKTLTARVEMRWENWFDSKLQSFELNTRYVLHRFFIRLGRILTFGTVLVMLLVQATLPEGEQTPLHILVPLFSGLFLFFLGTYMISMYDVSLIHFKKFRTTYAQFKELEKGLNSYNRAVYFNLQRKKLYTLTQYAKHIHALNLKKEIYQLNTNLDKIIQGLESRNLGEIPKVLVELSRDADSFIEEYGEMIKIELPLWTRTKEALASSFHKVLPQLIWVLIVVMIFLVLRMFVPIEISIP